MGVNAVDALYASRLRACIGVLTAVSNAIDGDDEGDKIEGDPKAAVKLVVAELTEDNRGFEIAGWLVCLIDSIGRDGDDE